MRHLLDGLRDEPRSPTTFGAAVRIIDGIKVDPATGCWNWQRAVSLGYGRIKYKGRLDLTHRVTYELFVGDLIPGLQIDHLCRNRACCNPKHLEQVTPIANQHRGSPRASHCHRGHELTVRADGRSDCRPCRIINQRAWREANPNWRTGVRGAA